MWRIKCKRSGDQCKNEPQPSNILAQLPDRSIQMFRISPGEALDTVKQRPGIPSMSCPVSLPTESTSMAGYIAADNWNVIYIVSLVV